jgi:hypothetical protein
MGVVRGQMEQLVFWLQLQVLAGALSGGSWKSGKTRTLIKNSQSLRGCWKTKLDLFLALIEFWGLHILSWVFFGITLFVPYFVGCLWCIFQQSEHSVVSLQKELNIRKISHYWGKWSWHTIKWCWSIKQDKFDNHDNRHRHFNLLESPNQYFTFNVCIMMFTLTVCLP